MLEHIIEGVDDIKIGNLSLRTSGYQCRCGWGSFDLKAVADHAVENQFEVKPKNEHNTGNLVLGGKKDLGKYAKNLRRLGANRFSRSESDLV